MKKIIKNLFLFGVIASVFVTPMNAFASSANKSDIAETQEITITPEQLVEGVTVLIVFNDDGSWSQFVYDNEATIPVPAATADGELEWAKFHLGFKDWNNDTGDLYFTVSADEAMSKISGTAYVESTSWLFPKSYYDSSFSEKLYSSYNTSRTLATDVDTEDETEVRVGFRNVILSTIAGDSGAFSNSSQIVER